ncbi:TlpA family protein disulfide reductase [Portibacter marinus]|uniref:TlpA family protein disulfide reductase n=1 Tax=Portibacter marinus TaxID=2898660 RepID=UPI001F1D1D65|nr:TlpA disulfide reductase family protein [Portibacter marinus]
MRIKYFLFFVAALMSGACEEKSEHAVIELNIADAELDQVVFYNKVDMRYNHVTNVKDQQYVIENVDGAEIIQFQATSNQIPIFVQPGTNVSVSKNAGSGFEIVSTDNEEQQLLEEFDKQMSIASAKYGLPNLSNLEPVEFQEQLQKKYAKTHQLLIQAKQEGVATGLISILRARMMADKVRSVINYPNYYEYLNKQQPNLPDDFYQVVEDFDINDEKAYYFDEAWLTAAEVVTRESDYASYDDVEEIYIDQYQKLDENISNEKVKELVQYQILTNKINYGGGIGKLGPQIKDFIHNAKDERRINELNLAMDKWAHLEKGLQAPDFVAYDRNGKAVRLSDLQGKNVYIDVWATWCGPCIAEIPALKSMEEKYHDENVAFVSVSIDEQRDREKWKKMIEARDLGGIQIIAENNWKSEIAQKYNISSIPRFMMIDAEGQIVSANAPRPSDSKGFNHMLAEVLD